MLKLPKNLPAAKLLLGGLTVAGAALAATDLPLWARLTGLLPAVAVIVWTAYCIWIHRQGAHAPRGPLSKLKDAEGGRRKR